jgi:hypothetical protein
MANRSTPIKEFLLAKGFKLEEPHAGDADYVVSNYYKVLYDVPDLPLCLCNDKPPQMWIQETYLNFGNGTTPSHNFTVGFRNEAPQGWIDFKFYSINQEEFLVKFSSIQEALIAAWKVLFTKD